MLLRFFCFTRIRNGVDRLFRVFNRIAENPKTFYISFTFFYRRLTSAGIKKNSFAGGFEKINEKTRKSIYAFFNDYFLHFLRTKAN